MKTHPLNVSYLVLGLVFLGISGSWALHAANIVDTAQIRWLLPLTLVVAGVIGLVAFATKGLGRDEQSSPPDSTTYGDSSADRYHDQGDPR